MGNRQTVCIFSVQVNIQYVYGSSSHAADRAVGSISIVASNDVRKFCRLGASGLGFGADLHLTICGDKFIGAVPYQYSSIPSKNNVCLFPNLRRETYCIHRSASSTLLSNLPTKLHSFRYYGCQGHRCLILCRTFWGIEEHHSMVRRNSSEN